MKTNMFALAFLTFSPLALLVPGAIGNVRMLFGASSLEESIASFESEFTDVPNITPLEWQEISQHEQDETVLIDVRSPSERSISKIPGAITLEEYQANRSQYADDQVVVYCTVGYRSAKTARELREKGTKALNFRGGILNWAKIGGSLVDGSGKRTNRVHTYARAWNFVPKDYVAIW